MRVLKDLVLLYVLDSVRSRAGLLLDAEAAGEDPTRLSLVLSRPWSLARQDVQHIAWKTLVTGPPRITVHARPLRPLPPKLDWTERELAE